MKKLKRINEWLMVSPVTNEAGAGPAEMLIYDRIGKDPYDDSGVGAQEFNAALKAIPSTQPVLVRINSPGGNVWDGMAIYNMLHAIRDRVTTKVDGIAASAASLIFLAGAKREMPKASLLMIHNPQDICFGNSAEMRARAEKLDQHKEAIAAIYTENSDMSKDEVSAAMDAETWLTGQQCVDCKMATAITEEQPVQNTFDLSQFRHVPGQINTKTKPTAPQHTGANAHAIMNRDEMLALLKNWGVTVPENSTDEAIKALVLAGKPVATPPAAAATPPANAADSRLAAIEQQLAQERVSRITAVINGLVENFQLTASEVTAAIARASKDETYLAELQSRPSMIPGAAPLNSGIDVIGADARDTMNAMRKHIVTGPACAAMDAASHAARGRAMTAIYTKERERIMPVLNTAATNTVDASLKRVVILNETIRDFATRIAPLRLFATVFSNIALQGTDTIAVPYYPLQTTASSDFTDGDGTSSTGYVFGQATTTNKALITVNKRKYQPIDYSSSEFRRQPWFDAVRLGKINAEKLGVDIVNDVLSIVTAANYGAAAKTAAAAAINSDDIIDIRGACNAASWPDYGRGLIVDSTVDTALQKDNAYKLALNIGTASVIQQGKFPNLSGFDYAWVPSFPTNSEKLQGIATFMSGILAAFCPVDPAPGVRAQLVAYEVVTDPASGVSLNYRHWGLAQADRDFEIIESAYGYQKGVGAAIKRICYP